MVNSYVKVILSFQFDTQIFMFKLISHLWKESEIVLCSLNFVIYCSYKLIFKSQRFTANKFLIFQ